MKNFLETIDRAYQIQMKDGYRSRKAIAENDTINVIPHSRLNSLSLEKDGVGHYGRAGGEKEKPDLKWSI